MKISTEIFSNELGTGVWLRPNVSKIAVTEFDNVPPIFALAFFGSSLSTRENLERKFPSLRFVTLKQTHSDILIESPHVGDAPDADAHWTQTPDVALAVRTADCVPVLLVDLEARVVVSIHAGWRGVENQIVCKSLNTLRQRGFNFDSAIALIGPHIGVASFEVGQDVAQRLEDAYSEVRDSASSTALRAHVDPAKACVDLLQIVQAQLRSYGIHADRQIDLSLDTAQSPVHESFRRDREHSGRQISFVALIGSPFQSK